MKECRFCCCSLILWLKFEAKSRFDHRVFGGKRALTGDEGGDRRVVGGMVFKRGVTGAGGRRSGGKRHWRGWACDSHVGSVLGEHVEFNENN